MLSFVNAKHEADVSIECTLQGASAKSGKAQILHDADRNACNTFDGEIGYNMLIRIPFLRDAAEIVLAHQEFFDGTGYPRQLKGEQIPLGARIFTVADSLDAMISDRPYRKALPIQHAVQEIKRCAGTQFDPKVVDVFMAIPEEHWIKLRENLGSSFCLAHLKNL